MYSLYICGHCTLTADTCQTFYPHRILPKGPVTCLSLLFTHWLPLYTCKHFDSIANLLQVLERHFVQYNLTLRVHFGFTKPSPEPFNLFSVHLLHICANCAPMADIQNTFVWIKSYDRHFIQDTLHLGKILHNPCELF